MGLLQRIEDGLVLSLGHRCLVGRATQASLRIQAGTVSAEHAAIYFSDDSWKVRDLASTNGTYLAGARLTPGTSHPLEPNAELGFGTAKPAWRLIDDSPPGPSARSADGRRVYGADGVLWLPDASNPDACIIIDEGSWQVDLETGPHTVENGETLELGGTHWTLELPPLDGDDPATTYRADSAPPSDGFGLRFSVSTDEEHVAVEANYRGTAVSLGARAHNYALLLLARRRLAEQGDASAGWVYTDELRSMLNTDRESMNLLLWRAKQQFKQCGLPAERLIERRADTRQLRIGVARLICEVV